MGRSRGKILIKKVEDQIRRQVTFCKRKNGLLKKGKQLSILCDVEVGVVIFSSTDKIYEFASSSMKLLFERYSKEREAQHQLLTPIAEAKLWKTEADSLRQQLHDLQESNRQVKGENLSGLGIGDVQNLESQLEASLKRIRTAKDQKFIDEIEELNRKEALIRQENMDLYKKLNTIFEENAQLHKKVHGGRSIGELEGCSTSSRAFSKEYDSPIPTNLQLSQVHEGGCIGDLEGCSTSLRAFSKEYDPRIPTNLQLSQVQPENHEEPEARLRLGKSATDSEMAQAKKIYQNHSIINVRR